MVARPEDEPSIAEMRRVIVDSTIDTEGLGAPEIPDLEAKVERMSSRTVVSLYYAILDLWKSVGR